MKSLIVPGVLESLDEIADYVIEAATAAGLETGSAYKLRLAVDEITTNIVSHGYGTSGREGNVELHIDKDETTLTLSIDDTGVEYDPSKVESPDVTAPPEERDIGGLGLHLVRESVDQFRYERVGDHNRNILVMNLPDGAASK